MKPIRFLTYFTFFILAYGQTAFAQDKVQKAVESLLVAPNKLEVCRQLEVMFEEDFMMSIEGREKLQLTHTKILEALEKLAFSERRKEINYLIYNKLAVEYVKPKNHSKAFTYFKKAEKYFSPQDLIEIYYAHYAKYETYSHLIMTDSVMNHANKLYATVLKIKHDSLTATADLLLGGALFKNKRFPESRPYFLKALAYFEQKEPKRANTSLYNTMGVSYRQEGNHDSARYYFQKTLKSALQHKDEAYAGISNGNIGYSYFLEKRYKESIPYLLEELRHTTANFKKNNKKLNASTNLSVIVIAEAYLLLGDMQKATFYRDSAANNLMMSHKPSLREFYRLSATYFAKQGKMQQAYEYMEKLSVVKDSITDLEMIRRAKQIDAQFNFNKQRREIDDLYKTNEQQERENRQKNYWLLGIGTVLLAMFALAYFLFKSNEKRKKMNIQLANQKEELKSQSEVLQNTNAKLIELDHFKQNLTGMIVHDLKNPLNALLNIVPKNLTQYHQQIQNYSRQMFNLVMNILDVQKFEETRMILEKRKTDFHTLIHEACAQVDFMAKEKNVELVIVENAAYYIELDVEIILRVLVNLLTNAIKYAPQNTPIEINTNIENQLLTCQVKDEGKGIPEDKLGLVFEKFVQLDNVSHKSYRSTGLGLTYCKMAVEAHEGKIWASSIAGKGASFIFTLPATQESITTASPTSTPKGDISELTPENKAILQPYWAELSKMEVYYTTDIDKILSNIPINNENMKIWEAKLKTAIRNFNQELYNQLIQQIV
jgi:signal transduction histidine kinase